MQSTCLAHASVQLFVSSLTYYCFALIKVAQGKKKGSKKEEKKKAKDSRVQDQAGVRRQNVNVVDERIMAHQQTAVADSIEAIPAADVQVAQAKTSNPGLVVSSLIGCAFDVLLLLPCVHMPNTELHEAAVHRRSLSIAYSVVLQWQ